MALTTPVRLPATWIVNHDPLIAAMVPETCPAPARPEVARTGVGCAMKETASADRSAPILAEDRIVGTRVIGRRTEDVSRRACLGHRYGRLAFQLTIAAFVRMGSAGPVLVTKR
jgi:hypothetical protein